MEILSPLRSRIWVGCIFSFLAGTVYYNGLKDSISFTLQCRCSMIMSVVNWSGKMSVWRDERETDIERKRAEAVGGIE
jgi:hypothetical protein